MKVGQTVLIRHRAWPGQRTDQPAIYTQLALLIPLFLCFKIRNPMSFLCHAFFLLLFCMTFYILIPKFKLGSALRCCN